MKTTKTHSLYTKSFKFKTMSQKKVVLVFNDLDRDLEHILDVIMQTGSFIDNYAATMIWEIAATANNRNIYKKMECRQKKTSVLSAEDSEFVIRGFDLLRALATNDRKSVKTAFFDLNFLRSVYEDIIKKFLDQQNAYEDLHKTWLKTQHKFIDNPNAAMFELRDVSDKMEKIENALATNRTYLMGTLRWLNYTHDKYAQARNLLVESYLRLVFATASEFAMDDYTLMDHYQVGTLGLLRGISNYNSDKGSFSAYAKLWIRQGILSSIKDMNLIKIPASTWQCYTTLERKRSAQNSNDIHRLSVATGITEDRISDVYEKVRTSQVSSLDKPVESDGDFEDGEIHSYEEIIEAAKPVEDEPPPSFDWVTSTLAKKIMICCHGDILDLMHMQPLKVSENDIRRERIRHLLLKIVN